MGICNSKKEASFHRAQPPPKQPTYNPPKKKPAPNPPPAKNSQLKKIERTQTQHPMLSLTNKKL